MGNDNLNLIIWDRLSRPPGDMLKPIQAGRLKGKSDINPQWRYKALTEEFGPCGVGWKYTIDKLWSVDGAEGQVFAFAEISLFIKQKDSWSDSIPGIGGSMLVEKESKGLHANDEGYKMAVTDALSVACKMIGVAADVYAGLWDGSKYKEPGDNGKGNKKPEPKPITEKLLKEIRDKVDKIEPFSSEDKTKFFNYLKTKAEKHKFKDKLVMTINGANYILKNFNDLHDKYMEDIPF